MSRAAAQQNGQEWDLVPVTADDLDAIHAIEAQTFVNDAWSRDLLAAELVAPHRHYIAVVEADRRIVGYAGLLSPVGGEGDIQTIAVRHDRRGLGLGRRLMNALIAEAVRRRNREVFLEVRKDNPPAIALYTDLGFQTIAERPGYYQPDNVDALVMRKVLPIAPEETEL